MTEKQPGQKHIIKWHLNPADKEKAREYDKHSRKYPQAGRRVFVVGHMVDQGKQVRLPDDQEHIDAARFSVWRALEKLDKQERINELVVCSGAAGADAFALEWMDAKRRRELELGVENPNRTAKMYLPFSREAFINYSVRYGNFAHVWAGAFDRASHFGMVYEPHLIPHLSPKALWTWLRVNRRNPSVAEAKKYSQAVNGFERQFYLDVNEKMLSELRPDTSDSIVTLWDGKGATLDEKTGLPKPGGTYDVLYHAVRRGVRMENIHVVQGGLVGAEKPDLSSLTQIQLKK